MGIFLLTSNPIFIIIVAIDYFIRAFIKIKFSPIRFIALGIVKILLLKKKLIGISPKIFASRLGFLVAAISVILIFTGFPTASLIIAGLLMILSLMDSVFNFCIGCIIYTYVVSPFYKKK